jgi:uncharacterized heparinase superfamily protein
VTTAAYSLIADLSPIGPDYIPGHAHADTLSFELSIEGQRIFVNSGTSEYGVSEERLRQRSTPAHNTVSVNGMNSSEVWSGFRVARRAKIISREVDTLKKVFSAAHDGFKQQGIDCIHERRWKVGMRVIEVSDFLHGRWKHAEGYLHLHPDVRVNMMSSSSAVIHINSLPITIELFGGELSTEPSTWHPQFGVVLPNQKIVYRFLDSKVKLKIYW